jgi:dihydroxyacid dehydratase/phosphogluconate dehydratase
MFTANSMNCLCEALGLALPTNGTLLATSAERKKLYCRAAQRIVEMVLQFERVGPGHGLLPREIVTQASVDNSMILDMAMGGSTIWRHAGHRRGPASTTTSNVSTNSAARRQRLQDRPQQ